MTAGLVAMELFDSAAVARLNKLGAEARSQVNRRDDSHRRDSGVRDGQPVQFSHPLKASPPENYRDSYVTPEEARRCGRCWIIYWTKVSF